MNKPFQTYFGGKQASGVPQQIINIIPPHQIYIEPFLGNGTILRMKKPASLANIGIDIDPAVVDKWHSLETPNFPVFQADAMEFLKITASVSQKFPMLANKIFIYCDPPYPMDSRKDTQSRYNYEMTSADHHNFLDVVRSIPANIAISTYPNCLYANLLKDWHQIEFTAKTRGGTAIERVYFNYERPTILHDYRYVGNTFRDRERIKKAQNNLFHKLSKMSIVERNATLEALAASFNCPF